jgi:hypothetical protein
MPFGFLIHWKCAKNELKLVALITNSLIVMEGIF